LARIFASAHLEIDLDDTLAVLEIFHLTRTETTLLQFAYFVSYLLVAPPMGIFMRRYGYKIGIHVGLGLFSIGKRVIEPVIRTHMLTL
jgi:fucose permease